MQKRPINMSTLALAFPERIYCTKRINYLKLHTDA